MQSTATPVPSQYHEHPLQGWGPPCAEHSLTLRTCPSVMQAVGRWGVCRAAK